MDHTDLVPLERGVAAAIRDNKLNKMQNNLYKLGDVNHAWSQEAPGYSFTNVTALHIAVYYKNVSAVSVLLRLGADPLCIADQVDHIRGATCIELATALNIQALFDFSQAVNTTFGPACIAQGASLARVQVHSNADRQQFWIQTCTRDKRECKKGGDTFSIQIRPLSLEISSEVKFSSSTLSSFSSANTIVPTNPITAIHAPATCAASLPLEHPNGDKALPASTLPMWCSIMNKSVRIKDRGDGKYTVFYNVASHISGAFEIMVSVRQKGEMFMPSLPVRGSPFIVSGFEFCTASAVSMAQEAESKRVSVCLPALFPSSSSVSFLSSRIAFTVNDPFIVFDVDLDFQPSITSSNEIPCDIPTLLNKFLATSSTACANSTACCPTSTMDSPAKRCSNVESEDATAREKQSREREVSTRTTSTTTTTTSSTIFKKCMMDSDNRECTIHTSANLFENNLYVRILCLFDQKQDADLRMCIRHAKQMIASLPNISSLALLVSMSLFVSNQFRGNRSGNVNDVKEAHSLLIGNSFNYSITNIEEKAHGSLLAYLLNVVCEISASFLCASLHELGSDISSEIASTASTLNLLPCVLVNFSGSWALVVSAQPWRVWRLDFLHPLVQLSQMSSQ